MAWCSSSECSWPMQNVWQRFIACGKCVCTSASVSEYERLCALTSALALAPAILHHVYCSRCWINAICAFVLADHQHWNILCLHCTPRQPLLVDFNHQILSIQIGCLYVSNVFRIESNYSKNFNSMQIIKQIAWTSAHGTTHFFTKM